MIQQTVFKALLVLSAGFAGLAFANPEAGLFQDAETFNLYRSTRDQISAGFKQSLSQVEIMELFKRTISNHVSRLDEVDKYDPTGAIGFCFGRAMTAHFVALQMGLAQSRIVKLFVVGDLRSDPNKGEWRFHVTTLVPGNDGKYYAIDPITYGSTQGLMPFEASEWIQFVRMGWDRWHHQAPRALFYVSEAETMLPDIGFLQNPEKGDKLIELNFNPLNNGFVAANEWKQAFGVRDAHIFRATSAQVENKYFSAADEEDGSRFNFEGLSVTDEVEANGGVKRNTYNFSYNNYFKLLLKTFHNNPSSFKPRGESMSERMSSGKALNHSGPAATKPLPKNLNRLGSFRFPLKN